MDLVDLGVALVGTAFDLVLDLADLGVALVTALDLVDFGVAVALPVPLLLRFTPLVLALALAGEARGAAAGVSSFVGMLLLSSFYVH